MADVAAHAGVSITTVSHVLNGTRTVAPATVTRVRNAVETLGYQTPRAQGVATNTIGFVASNASYAYFAEVVLGVEAEARERGFALLLCASHDDPAIEEQAISALLNRHVDGILISPTADWKRRALPLLSKRPTPFVLVDRSSGADFDQVVTENTAPAERLVSHLAELGHSRIAILTGLPNLSTTSQRLVGYQRALRRWRLPENPDLIVPGESSSKGGRHAVRELLKLAHPPTAIFSSNDAMTVGALQALSDAGLKVPDDVALVAFDDFEWGDVFTPSITVAAQPAYMIGAEAVKLLDLRLRDVRSSTHSSTHTARLPADIIHRSSCGCDHDAFPPRRLRI
jgi:LacI family transcriptional regulator